MKKIIYLIFISSSLSFNAQDYGALSVKSGSTYFNNNILFGPGANFNFEITKNLNLGLDIDYHRGASNSSLVIFQPKIFYYIKNSFDGIHFGAFFGVNFTGDNKLFDPTVFFTDVIGFAGSYGANFGYSFPISEKFYVDAGCDGGFIYLKYNETNYLYLKPQVSIGFKFK